MERVTLVRRPGAQLTPFEFVIIFLIGGVIILATVGNDHSETNCTCAIITVGLTHRLVSIVRSRFPRLAAWIYGIPLVVLRDGQWQLEQMEGLRVDREDVIAAAREKGLISARDVEYAVVERNGSISIIPR